MAGTGSRKPQRIHGRSQKLYDALKAAGIIHEGDYVRRVVIDICAEKAVQIYVERFADERLLDVDLLAELRIAAEEGAREKVSGEDPEREYQDALAEHAHARSELERTEWLVDRAYDAYQESLESAG